MNIINFLAKTNACGIKGLENVFYYATLVVKVIQIAAPIALIIWGSIDLLKAVIDGDGKKIAEKRKPFIQRLISAVIIFLIPWIVNTVLTGLANSGTDWAKCYSASKTADKGITSSPDPASYK